MYYKADFLIYVILRSEFGTLLNVTTPEPTDKIGWMSNALVFEKGMTSNTS